MQKQKRDKDLTYPFETVPAPGELQEVAEGIFWLRMPLPFSLNHINLWALKDGDAWTIVDSGMATEDTIEQWQQLFESHDLPVKRILCTHMHPDHIGLAGWLAKRCDAQLWMSREEYLTCQHMISYSHEEAPQEALDFYHRAGLDDSQLERFKARFGSFGKFVRALPHSFINIQNDDEIRIGDKVWQVITGQGHSVEHVCLYCVELNVFISGDQLLPTISSNVSVRPTEPEANPLEEWIASCHRISERINNETLVLPAHGKAFKGGPIRFKQLIDEHESDLEKLLEFCEEPQMATDTFDILFRSAITNGNRIMALGEGIAHLHCLRGRGLVERMLGDDGIYRFVKV